MERTAIKETINKVSEEVKLSGFVENHRVLGKMTFIQLRDKTGSVQCVGYDMMKDLTLESVVEITGEVKQRPEKQVDTNLETGTVEIDVKEYNVLSKSEGLPIQVNEMGMNEADIDKRMDFRWIDLRKDKNLLIFKVWTEVERAMREYWAQNNFMEIHSPKLLGAPSESGAEVFEVKYFEGKAYLAQSPQFYKQMAMAAGFEKVFEVGPVFRAEKSLTVRHATEFTGFDSEISYIDSYQDVIKLVEGLIVAAMTAVKEKYGEEIKKIFNIDIVVPSTPFPQMKMSEIKEELGKLGIPSEKYGDLSSEEEKALGELVKEKFGHEFVFATEYPKEFRAFYHMWDEETNKLSQSADLIFKGLEIVTLAQREHRYEKLTEHAKEFGMDTNLLQFYLDFFRYGCPPHGGFGMGPARLIAKMLGLPSIREASFLFRNPKRLNP